MAIIDIVLLICFVPAIVYGIRKGFVKQVVELVSIIVGVWAAFYFSSSLSVWLSQYISIDKVVLHIVSFILIVVLVVFLMGLLGSLLTRLLKIVFLGWINGLLGLVIGVFKVAVVLGLLIMLFESVNASAHIVDPSSLDNATVYHALRDLAGKIFPYIKNYVTGLGQTAYMI